MGVYWSLLIMGKDYLNKKKTKSFIFFAQTPPQKMSIKTVFTNIVWTTLALAVISAFIFGAYVARFSLVKSSFISIGLYGCILAAHYTLQILFALLARRQTNKALSNRWNDWVGVSCGLLIVGYREDGDLFRQCLLSARKQEYDNKAGIIVVVDGNSAEKLGAAGDMYMGEIFNQVFLDKNPCCIVVPFILSERLDVLDEQVIELYSVVSAALNDGRPVCILQPHHGKRAAMYTGFQMFMYHDVEAIIVTDSDTKLDPMATKELAATLVDNNVGAACGEVLIWNKDSSLIAFLSSLRYYSAFNIERACQSFFGCVGCVSGPLGIYRKSCLKEILPDWLHQKSLGSPCTYGDDRHLTNLVLSLSKRVKYTHLAKCLTETPDNYFRWLTQQTRWSKSFFREQFITISFFYKQSPWMTYEMIFNLIYPFVVLFSMTYVLFHQSTLNMMVMFTIVFLAGFVRAIVMSIISGSTLFLFYPMYGYIYIFGLLAAKFQALIFLWDTTWGTSPRGTSSISFRFHQTIFPILWILIVLGGITFNVADNYVVKKSHWGHYETIAASVLGCILVGWMIVYSIFRCATVNVPKVPK